MPGIGKTLCVKDVAKKACEGKRAKVIYVNALTIKRPLDIFKVIHYEMTKTRLESINAMYELGTNQPTKTAISKKDLD